VCIYTGAPSEGKKTEIAPPSGLGKCQERVTKSRELQVLPGEHQLTENPPISSLESGPAQKISGGEEKNFGLFREKFSRNVP